MSTFDYILDSALVLIVLLQIKEKRLRVRELVRPVIILGVAVAKYLTSFPTQGHDLLLIAVLAGIGSVLGTCAGLTTIMRRRADGTVGLRSGWVACFFWVAGMGARFAFAYWTSHGGAGSLQTFSAHHDITTGNAWTVALLLMAAGEILVRTAIIAWRWRALERTGSSASSQLDRSAISGFVTLGRTRRSRVPAASETSTSQMSGE